MGESCVCSPCYRETPQPGPPPLPKTIPDLENSVPKSQIPMGDGYGRPSGGHIVSNAGLAFARQRISR